jgi:protocatechuate 3,4-dioxygenase beta subunit
MSLHRAAPAIVLALVCTMRGTSTDRQQTAQSQSGTATITGTVVTLSSGEPIADASVSLYESTLPDGRLSTTTDSQGRFGFTKLASGRYTVGAVKTGFVTVVLGERHYGRGGRAMAIRDSEHRDIRLQLPRPSVITGRIVDEHGKPAIGASLRALRFSMAFGYRRAMSVGMATTDSQGIFRIESLTPGDYAVCAATHQTGALNEGQRLRMEIDRERRSAAYVLGPEGVAAQKNLAPQLAQLEARLSRYLPPVRGYAPMCYPGSTSALSMITLAPDEERTGVNMQFAVTRLARIEGIVTGMPADNRDLDPIMLLSADELREGPPADSTRPDFEGRFTFTNIPPGRYKLFVPSADNGPSPGARTSATAEVVVADEDISNVVLDLEPGVTASGQVVFRGSVPPPAAAAMARAGLEIRLDAAVLGPLSHWPGPSITRPDATGRFVLHDVFPGTYRIRASQREASGWFFDTTMIPGADVTGQLVEVKRQDLTGIAVTLTDRRTELSGTIMTDKGEPAPEYFILLYPSDEKYWTPYSDRLYGTRAKQDGTFVVGGLHAGRYRLATLLDAEFGAWFDPAFLRRIDSTSMAVSIADDERTVLTLRVPGDR